MADSTNKAEIQMLGIVDWNIYPPLTSPEVLFQPQDGPSQQDTSKA